MIKRLLFSLLIAFTSLISFSQDMPSSVDEVIIWNFSITYEDNCEAVINMTATQKDHWHVYAQEQPTGSVAYATEFTFPASSDYELIGKVREYGAEEHDNEGYPEKYFPGEKAKFKQRIKLKSENDFKIKVEYGFMACKTACFPPDFREVEIKCNGRTGDCEVTNIEEGDTGDIEIELIDSTADNSIQSDSTLLAALATCEGSTYSGIFDPIKIRVSDPWRTDKMNYSLSVNIEIDSIFAMYAFDNPQGYKSIFSLNDDSNIESKEDYTTTINKVVGEDTKGYKYEVVIQQNITIKDTNKLSVLTAELDLYLMGCENDFHNTENTSVSFDLTSALDNGVRTDKDSLWLIFFLAFIGGFLALLTPCVFPMIPMTVSFFTKQSKTKAQGIRKAFLYSGFIVGIYVILGVLVASLAGADALNAMATDPIVNIVFFVLFIVFAISFFGAFEITLPASWVNKADKQADRGGILGIFFMAFTLALVSFSCTGPIVGSVLVQSAQGGISGPIVAMLGFSLALALPFGLFAAFPGWLNSLPSSGGWLNTVKVVLGFIEVALALKFLSNADLVMQWHFLEREMFLAIWIAVFIMLFIYLLGKIQFPHDSPMQKLSVGRGMFAMVILGFTIYLIPGLFGAPLKWISGFPPPISYSEAPYGFHGSAPEVSDEWPESTHAHGHGINVIRDYYEALEYAKEVDKPLLVDFTGWACVNCRKMEEFVWADETISPMMAKDFVIASLYVDDRGEIAEQYKGDKDRNGEVMETIGDKWMNMQIEKYQEVTQPMYVILDHNENNISGKANYQTHGNVDAFKAWLEKGAGQFVNSKNATLIVPQFEIIE
ncbi:MAG: thiol:disulfide interchange protein [Arenicella sp.]|jgi:thiol:disulfide interchange protein